MPLGWYLAQGMVPLGPSSSDEEEGPCELPDGRIVCGPHGLVTCYKCCTSYDFDGDGLSPAAAAAHPPEADAEADEEADAELMLQMLETLNTRGRCVRFSGSVFPTAYAPPQPTQNPTDVFTARRKVGDHRGRLVLPSDRATFVIHTDGSCTNNGRPDAKAAWAFWFARDDAGRDHTVSGALEKKGPFGDDGRQTSNRAELRAVLAALRYRRWDGEGFGTLVVATDSTHVVKGATTWARSWVRHGWRDVQGNPVKNRDMWEAVLGEVERCRGDGLTVKFWAIPRESNGVADRAARQAVETLDTPEEYVNIVGFLG